MKICLSCMAVSVLQVKVARSRTRTETRLGHGYKNLAIKHRISFRKFNPIPVSDIMSEFTFQFDIRGSEIRITLISFITEIGLKHHLWCKIRCENWSERTRTLRFGPSRRGFY
jgi:hypothetical protein